MQQMALRTISLALMVFFVKDFTCTIAQDFGFSFPDHDGGAEEENSCTTNSGSQGTCVSFSKCTTISIASFSTIRPKLCRWEGIDQIICCPLQSPSSPLKKAPPPTPAPIATSVSSSLPAECAVMSQRSSNPRIKRASYVPFVLGGIDARVGEWPFMAALFRNTDNMRSSPFCGGSLIGPDVVLTAAHCFAFESSDMKYVVILGATNLINGDTGVIPISREVSKVIVHEDYQYPIAYHDIAIMKLRVRVPFTGAAKPICLPYDAITRQDFAGQTAKIIGWGHTEFGGRSAKTLQFADVPITTNSDCQNSYRSINAGDNLPSGVVNNLICAGSKSAKQDTCQGDSGGPLVIKDPRGNKAIIIGIVSAGFECGKGIPGLYTRVTQYLRWIAQNSR